MSSVEKIKRHLRKLRKASPSELCCRTAEFVHRLREHVTCWFPSEILPATTFEQVTQRAAHLFPGQTASSVQALREAAGPLAIKAQEEIFSRYGNSSVNNFHLFDIKVDVFQPISWHIDPKTGTPWPKTFYKNVPLAGVNVQTDVKYVWELGRQLFAVELARHWAVNRKESAARRSIELMHSFLRDNPPYIGVHWASALEVAVRSIHWLWAIAALADRTDFPYEFKKEIVRALVVNADFLLHHLSYYSSPYNHIIGEAAALYLLSYVLKDERRSRKWACASSGVLEKFAPQQLYEDGFSVEQSVGYHFYTLGFLIQAGLCARLQGRRLPVVEETVPRAVRAALKFRQPDGTWPVIGDCDSARSVPVIPGNFWDFSGLCNLAAVLWNDPTLLASTDSPGQELTWMLGDDGARAWEKLLYQAANAPNDRAARKPVVHVLAQAGYAIISNSHHYLVFDAGPLAAGVHSDATPSAAHGHADMLHLIYWREGKQLLFDSGMYCYNGDAQTLRYCRSPQAHNTVEIEGCPIAVDSGGLAWAHVTAPPGFRVTEQPNATAIHATWKYRDAAVIQRKVVLFSSGPLLIIDRITTDAPRLVYWNWQLPAPSAVINQVSNQLVLKSHGYQEVFQLCSSRDWTKVELNRADSSPAGWRYYGYRLRQPGCRLRVAMECAREAILVTCIGRPGETVGVRLGPNYSVALGPKKNRTVIYEDPEEHLVICGNEI